MKRPESEHIQNCRERVRVSLRFLFSRTTGRRDDLGHHYNEVHAALTELPAPQKRQMAQTIHGQVQTAEAQGVPRSKRLLVRALDKLVQPYIEELDS